MDKPRKHKASSVNKGAAHIRLQFGNCRHTVDVALHAPEQCSPVPRTRYLRPTAVMTQSVGVTRHIPPPTPSYAGTSPPGTCHPDFTASRYLERLNVGGLDTVAATSGAASGCDRIRGRYQTTRQTIALVLGPFLGLIRGRSVADGADTCGYSAPARTGRRLCISLWITKLRYSK